MKVIPDHYRTSGKHQKAKAKINKYKESPREKPCQYFSSYIFSNYFSMFKTNTRPEQNLPQEIKCWGEVCLQEEIQQLQLIPG